MMPRPLGPIRAWLLVFSEDKEVEEYHEEASLGGHKAAKFVATMCYCCGFWAAVLLFRYYVLGG
jgi:hypothetical protein